MARQYLAEGVQGAVVFDVDRTKPFVTESASESNGGRVLTRMSGRLSVCDCVNGNQREYGKSVWEKNLAEGSTLQRLIAENASFGCLEHPKDGLVGLNNPDISHQVTAVKMVEGKGPDGKPRWEVHGEISVYEDTPAGARLMAFIKGGYNPLVSSRGFGSLVKDSRGVDVVQDDFVCEGWDVVRTPSFEQAQLNPMREPIAPSTTARMAAKPPTAESVQPAASAPSTPPLSEASASAPAKPSDTKPVQPSQTSTTMEITEVRQRISALRGADPTKLDPRRLAESLSEIEALHTEVASYAAADPKRSYEGQRLHRDLEAVTEALTNAAAAPRQRAGKLAEDNQKLMQVVQATATTAVTYKKKLGESVATAAKLKETVTEATRRGRGWHKIAEDRGQKLAKRNEQFDTACEALDIMAARYHADTTELGRRLLQVEFKDKLAANPALAEKLTKATRLTHVGAIREELEGKKPKEGAAPSKEAIKGAKKGSGEAVADAPGKVTTESAEGKPAAAPARPVTEAKVQFGTDRDPRSLSESVEMARRLSGNVQPTSAK